MLASASPARSATLRSAGLDPEVIVSGFDEDSVRASDVSTLVDRLATVKAQSVAATLTGPALVLGCDSLLDIDGEALGKPADAVEARTRWRRLRGRSGVLRTGHCLVDVGPGLAVRATASTVVHFGRPSDHEIDQYVASGEPLAVAGAFTIDGLGGWFIDSIEGDHHNVVGLSLPVLRALLTELGYALTDLGYPASRS